MGRDIRSLKHPVRGARSACALAALACATATLLALGPLAASPARADAASEARVRYERALKFYDEGVYDAALVELTRANELNPSYRITYNIAQTRVAMRDYAAAIETFQRYLREAFGKISNERVAEVRAQLNELQQRVGKLTIETDVSDAELLLDDVVIGTAPLAAPVVVNAGLRRVSVRHPDHPMLSQRVSVAGGEQQRVTLLLLPGSRDTLAAKPAPAATRPAAPAPTPPPVPPRLEPTPAAAPAVRSDAAPQAEADRTLAWVATGVSVALAASAGVLGGMALAKNSDLKDRRDQPAQDVAAFNSDRTQMNRLAAIADGLAVATLVAAAATAFLWLRDDGSRAETAARPHVGVAVSMAGARLAGEF